MKLPAAVRRRAGVPRLLAAAGARAASLRRLGRALRDFAARVAQRYGEDRCARVAGALSFTTLLALVPLTAVAMAVVAVFPVFRPLLDALQEFVYANFVPAAGDVVNHYLQQFARNAGRLTVWGLVFLVVASLMVMATIERTFNDIWHVRQSRKPLHRLLGYWALLTLGPALIGLSLSVTSYIVSLPLFAKGAPLGGLRAAALGALPPLAEWLAFLLLYTVAPSFPVRLRHALVGSLLAMVLFELAKRGFGWFVLSFPTYRLLYGALAALPIFLVWIYLSWVVTLLGAIVTATLAEWGVGRGRVGGVAVVGGIGEKLRRRRAERRR
jgi:membrane protein